MSKLYSKQTILLTLKALLFGASGQLGKEWQHTFADQTDQLLLIPYNSSQLDITSPENIEHEVIEHKPDLIINCAAYTNVDEAEKEKNEAQAVNTKAVRGMAAICNKRNIKLIHFSTDYIFSGSKGDHERFPGGYPETHNANPINWYGQTKWEGEEAIRNSGCEHLIIRVSWLCGAYGANFVKTMLRLSETHDQLRVVNDQLGSPTFADNLVRNTFQLIKKKRTGTFHLSSNGMISWAQFAETIFLLSDKQTIVNAIPSSEYPTEAARPYFSKLNTTKIAGINGVVTEGWKEGLTRLLKNINQ